MLNIVLFGPPGAGKGTQAIKIKKKYDLIHLSTGDLLRNEIKAKTDLGLKAEKIISRGELVPDDIVVGIIGANLDRNSDAKGFIFDGFPRTTAQAIALDKILEEKGSSISLMLSLYVERQELIDRLLKRGKDSGRTDDQDLQIIENRIKVYSEQTAPLVDYYSEQGKYETVNGIGSIDEIFERLCNAIDKHLE
jgi:adenylate kinase